MKFGITAREKLGLTIHLHLQPAHTPEVWRRRFRAWDELGVNELVEEMGENGSVKAEPWKDSTTPLLVDFTPDTLDMILEALKRPKKAGEPDPWTDVLGKLYFRLEALRDKRYQLPQELRETKLKAAP